MIIEIATAAQSDIPPMQSPAQQCKYQDPQKIKQCLDLKMRTLQQPDGDLWDPNWVSSVTPVPEVGITNTSANAANPNVAKKPLK